MKDTPRWGSHGEAHGESHARGLARCYPLSRGAGGACRGGKREPFVSSGRLPLGLEQRAARKMRGVSWVRALASRGQMRLQTWLRGLQSAGWAGETVADRGGGVGRVRQRREPRPRREFCNPSPFSALSRIIKTLPPTPPAPPPRAATAPSAAAAPSCAPARATH